MIRRADLPYRPQSPHRNRRAYDNQARQPNPDRLADQDPDADRRKEFLHTEWRYDDRSEWEKVPSGIKGSEECYAQPTVGHRIAQSV